MQPRLETRDRINPQHRSEVLRSTEIVRTRLVLAMVALPVLTGSWALAQEATTPPITAVWELQSLTVSGKTQPPPTALTRPTISFDGRAVSGSSFCNVYRASYVSRADLLRFGTVATTKTVLTTKKACVPILNTLERQYLGLLSATTKYIVSGPNLTLYSGSRNRMLFTQKGKATAASEARDAPVPPVPSRTVSPSAQIQTMMVNPAPALSQKGLPPARTIFDRATATLGLDEQLMVVAPQQADCVSVVPQRCLLVKRPTEAVWSLFYGSIEGFVYQSGRTSLLRVRLERLPRPAADGSSLRYRLIRVLGTQMALERVVARTPLKGTQWQLVSINNVKVNSVKTKTRPPFFSIENRRILGSDGCNGFSATVSVEENTVSATSPITGTQMACSTLLYRPSFTDLFRRGASYRILGQSLTLTGGGNIWIFKSMAVPVPTRPPAQP